MGSEKLRAYRAKRDFATSPEPAGGTGDGIGAGARFVIQEHHATRLHWDLRLEHDGALASWAIPNGIPPDPSENRLAVHTEDHPLEYLHFEGEIPRGEYGAGTMRIWDRGTFETHKWDENKVEITFHGERLQGRYGLFPLKRDGSSQDWMIHRMDPPTEPGREPMPDHVVPMLARSGSDLPPDERRWSFEVKWDGVRAIAYAKPGRLRLESRNLNEITASYPEVRGLLGDLGMREAVLDGEIVAFDEAGRPSFERLQRRIHVASDSVIRRRMADTPVVYAIFDLLYLDGRSLMTLPYAERRAALEALELRGPAWRVPSAHGGAGRRLLAATREQGLEGVVAKRLDSRYEPGRRTGVWVKIKNTRRQELVIAGWLPGEGRRGDRIGALLVGYFDGDELRYAGRVGTGFTEQTLDQLADRLAPLRRERSPFVPAPKLPRNAVFVEPSVVGEIEFIEWTREAVLRAPSFKGLRDDVHARDVVLEPGAPGTPTTTSATTTEAPEKTRTPKQTRTRAKTAATPAELAAATPAELAAATPAELAAATPAELPAATPEALFDQVERLADGSMIVLTEGRRLKLSNWDKVFYPETGFTKGDLIAYYARVAPAVLPHLRDRPLTLKRYPNGVEEQFFYEKNSPSHRPDWVQTARVGEIDYTLAQDRPTLIWLANLADIELHTSLALAPAAKRPTMMVFDLDPGAPAGLLECGEVALVLRGLFEQLHLQSAVKTSGSKGLQVYVPLNTPATYEQTKAFARRIAELLEQRMPELVVSRMTKRLRAGKVLVDWSQNDAHKTTVTVYSARARERPTASTPVAWDEVERCRSAGEAGLLTFDTEAVLARAAEQGDLFAAVLSAKQALPRL